MRQTTVAALAAVILMGGGSCCEAQTPPGLAPAASSPFVPFMVDERSYNEVLAYLRQQPYMFSAPLVAWLEQSAAAARQARPPPEPEPPK